MRRKRLPPDDPREWISRAKTNLALASNLIPDVDLEDLCFDAQQAAEKGIKAVFIKRGETFPYSHDLDNLLRLLETNGLKIPQYVNEAKEDLREHRTQIVQAFDKLAGIEGIRFTGAAKILHLVYPLFFVMWDRFISGQYPKREYLKLEIVQSGFWPYRKFVCSGDGYFDFLEVCQERFQGLVSPDPNRSLAKCIDEFNFTMITFPIAKALRKLPEA